MKFLCVECDQPMVLEETSGPDDGSMTVVFMCTACNRSIAMLTNAMETQMVHSLRVTIGGTRTAPEPMETIRSSLVSADSGPDVNTANETGPDLPWTPEAESRLSQIPLSIRIIVQKEINDYAAQHRLEIIDNAVIDAVRYGSDRRR